MDRSYQTEQMLIQDLKKVLERHLMKYMLCMLNACMHIVCNTLKA